MLAEEGREGRSLEPYLISWREETDIGLPIAIQVGDWAWSQSLHAVKETTGALCATKRSEPLVRKEASM